jgi:hypothetical protein
MAADDAHQRGGSNDGASAASGLPSSASEPAVDSKSDPTDSGAERFVLDHHQRFLRDVLQQRAATAAAMYVGALQVLADDGNPDRLALAAHGIRELIKELPAYFNLPVPIRGAMGNRVTALHQAWKKARPNMHPEKPLPGALWAKLEGFFGWFEAELPTWKQRTTELLRGLDPAGRPLPAPIEKLRVEEWLLCNEFFVTSAHHASCSEEDFAKWLSFFEHFLLDLVRPRTFDNADKIDALIKEAEADG